MREGILNAPVLCIVPSPPSDGMKIWLYERMRECGIKQTDIQLVSILNEEPANTGNRPSIAQLRESLDRMRNVFSESTPKVVVALGGDALYMATGLKVKLPPAIAMRTYS